MSLIDYFAYGANLQEAEMAVRCPGARPGREAVLADHRFYIMEEGWASVAPETGSSVWGRVWKITEDDLEALDLYEGIAERLYVRTARRIAIGDSSVIAQVYLGVNRAEGAPQPGYLTPIVESLRQLPIPTSYVDQVRGWSGPGRAQRRYFV